MADRHADERHGGPRRASDAQGVGQQRRASRPASTGRPSSSAPTTPSSASSRCRSRSIVPKYQQGRQRRRQRLHRPRPPASSYAHDRQFSAGRFGCVGSSSRHSTTDPIAGTTRDPLYQDLRVGMSTLQVRGPQRPVPGRPLVRRAPATRSPAGACSASRSRAARGVRLRRRRRRPAGASRRVDRTFFVEVTDGVLDIEFIARAATQPIVNAILVTEMPPGSLGF